MKYLQLCFLGAALGLLAGCSSPQSENDTTTHINTPYVPEVGTQTNHVNGVATQPNTVTEPSGSGAPGTPR